MKKVAALVMVLVMVSGCAMAECNFYADTFVVCEVNYDDDIVALMDFNGFIWTFGGCEDWCVGDICSVLMDINNTDIITDDTIVSYSYSGWIEGPWGWNGEEPLLFF